MPRNVPDVATLAQHEAEAQTAVNAIRRDESGRLIDPATVQLDKPALVAKTQSLSAKVASLIAEGKHQEASAALTEHQELTAQLTALDAPTPGPNFQSRGSQELGDWDRAAGWAQQVKLAQMPELSSQFFADPDAAMRAEEHEVAAAAKERAMRDPEWVKLYNNGDPGALAQMLQWNNVLTTRIFDGDHAAWRARFSKYLSR